MTVLVTGGAGFIGSNVVRALLEQGADVVVLDDFSTGRRDHLPTSPKLAVVEADLADHPGLERLVQRCDFVFHLAAQVGTMPSLVDPVRDAHSNIIATVRLLAACRDSPVRKIVCSASAAVFGEALTTPMDEGHPQSPESFYALSKLSAERYAVLASQLLRSPTVSLRYFNVYGQPLVRGEYAGVIVAFLDRLKTDETLVIHGDGSQDRDFVYVKDVVAANLAAALRGRPGAVYNIGTGIATSVLELATLMSEMAGKPLRVDFQPFRAGEVRHSVAAIASARADLGYEPAFDLRSGLADIWPRVWPTGAPDGR
jgi:UDP-glucose 4-epimerase